MNLHAAPVFNSRYRVWYAFRYAKVELLHQRHALAEPLPGGNGFVRTGVVAETAPSWRVNCPV